MKRAPKKYDYANARQLLFKSRETLAILFLAFFTLGVVLVVFWDGAIAMSVGTSLIASAAVSLATLMIEQVRNGEQIRMQELLDTGLLAAHQQRGLDDYGALVERAKEIDVTGYTLKSFSEQNEPRLRKRAGDGSPIQVRILLVDPSLEASEAMERAEGLPRGHYAGTQLALVTKLSNIEGVTVRTLRQHLSMMIYRIDGVLYTGPYPRSANSANAFTLEIRGGWMLDRQMEDFDALWAMGDPSPSPPPAGG